MVGANHPEFYGNGSSRSYGCVLVSPSSRGRINYQDRLLDIGSFSQLDRQIAKANSWPYNWPSTCSRLVVANGYSSDDFERLVPVFTLGDVLMCVAIARQSGEPSLSMIELFVLKSYFIFQVVQVFLVTTLTAAISASLTKILEDPWSVRNLLSESLPKASNFYVSYLVLQGLAMSATRVVHLPSLHRAVFASGKTPRMISTRWHRLKSIHWGSDFPLFANMGVIG